MRVALAQINTTVGDLNGNRTKIQEYILRAKKMGADIVVFPEMAICGYPPEDLLFKDHFIKAVRASIRLLARKISDITVVVGCVDIDDEGNIYNAAAVITQKKVVGIYRKEELPNYGVFDEKRYFEKGRNNKIFAFDKTAIGISICEDIWFPKGVCLTQSQKGARVLLNLSCSPYDMGKFDERIKLLKERARETGAYICYVNLVGGQDELVFDGGSLILSPEGSVIASGAEFEEDLVIADLKDIPSSKIRKDDLAVIPASLRIQKLEVKHTTSHKTDVVERIYKALVLGTRDYVMKNGFRKVVLGLSGGIDSAIVADIAVKALGADNVIAVTMPSRYTSAATRKDAIKLAKNLGISILEFSIESIFDSYLDVLSGAFSELRADTTEENLQARIRGNILMALSNKFGWMVLTTGNKSEMAVGYCTLYGDMSGGFAVIKDVPKTKVYELANFINLKKEVIPVSTIDRAPTAELRHNQKDQDSLPPYSDLDKVLIEYVENRSSYRKMSKNHDPETVKAIVQLVDRNEYKRRQAPPGVKITTRAFGKDWRLPITNLYKEF